MVKLQLKDSKHWKSLIEAINAVVTETNIYIDAEAMTLTAMDSVRVAMMSMKIMKDDFEVFELPNPVPAEFRLKIGINLTDLLKIIKRADSNDIITLEIANDTADKLIHLSMLKEGTTRAKKFSLRMIDIDEDKIPFDQLMSIPLSDRFSINTEFLAEAFADSLIYTDGITVIANDKGIMLKNEGAVGAFEYELEKNDLIYAELPNQCENTFTIVKLQSLLKITSVSPMVEISFDNEAPMRWTYKLYQNSSVVFFIAPRVESTDDVYAE